MSGIEGLWKGDNSDGVMRQGKDSKSLDRFSAEDTNKKRIQVARHLNQDHLKLIQADQTNETDKKIK